jgi:hypothetical protein
VGTVSGRNDIGGFAGNNSGTITNSFWDRERTGRASSAGLPPSNGLTTAEMQSGFAFTDWNTDIWEFTAGQYPRFMEKEPVISGGGDPGAGSGNTDGTDGNNTGGNSGSGESDSDIYPNFDMNKPPILNFLTDFLDKIFNQEQILNNSKSKLENKEQLQVVFTKPLGGGGQITDYEFDTEDLNPHQLKEFRKNLEDLALDAFKNYSVFTSVLANVFSSLKSQKKILKEAVKFTSSFLSANVNVPKIVSNIMIENDFNISTGMIISQDSSDKERTTYQIWVYPIPGTNPKTYNFAIVAYTEKKYLFKDWELSSVKITTGFNVRASIIS